MAAKFQSILNQFLVLSEVSVFISNRRSVNPPGCLAKIIHFSKFQTYITHFIKVVG